MHFLKLLFIPCKENEYRPRILGRSGLLMLLALMLAAEGFLVTSVIVRQTGGPFLAAVEEAALIALTNQDRTSSNLSRLIESSQLDAAAQAKANDMAANGYFSHVGPDGKEPWSWISEAGYAYDYAGENLAVHFSDSSDVERAWMASPTHRANILKSQYTYIGVGVAMGMYNNEPATYVVQYFASPKVAPLASLPAATPTQAGAVAKTAPATPATPAETRDSSLPATPPSEGQAAGAATPGEGLNPAAVSVSTQENSLVRAFFKAVGSPKSTAEWILGVMLSLLIIALGLTFFIHMRIQPGELLLGGATLAGVALLFLLVNSTLLPATTSIEGQAASIIAAPFLVADTPASNAVITASSSTRPTLIE